MRIPVLCVAATALCGCTFTELEPDPNSVAVVPVETVINSLKCGFARALDQDRSGRSGLRHAKAVINLDVNLVRGVDSKGNISAGIPVSTGVTITPAFSFTGATTRTLNTKVNFSISLADYTLRVCDAAYAVGHDAGFSIWIGQVVGSLGRATAGPPYASLQGYEYDSEFKVVQSATVGADATIALVKAGASVSPNATDVNKLKITIAAVHIGKDGKLAPDGTLFGGRLPIDLNTLRRSEDGKR